MPLTKTKTTKAVRETSAARAPRRTPQEKAADLAHAMEEIRSLLEKYTPPLEVRTDAKGGYHLWSVKNIVVEGRKRKEVYFAGVTPQKGYISFHYMPVYTNPEQKSMLIKPELRSLLKGKSCFYVRRLEPALKTQIKDALASGFRLYQQQGWI
ncbi:MAG: DUF1801 domain-containing protein [Chloroflexi bacterium]|nr:DUF1801 domain-containing protein [Chloroflexota bacterium]